MVQVIERPQTPREALGTAKVIERVAGHYDVEEVEYGRVYRRRPEMVVVECECGKRATFKRSNLITSIVTCGCGARYAAVDIQEEEDDETVHPWRYWRPPKGAGIPF